MCELCGYPRPLPMSLPKLRSAPLAFDICFTSPFVIVAAERTFGDSRAKIYGVFQFDRPLLGRARPTTHDNPLSSVQDPAINTFGSIDRASMFATNTRINRAVFMCVAKGHW